MNPIVKFNGMFFNLENLKDYYKICSNSETKKDNTKTWRVIARKKDNTFIILHGTFTNGDESRKWCHEFVTTCLIPYYNSTLYAPDAPGYEHARTHFETTTSELTRMTDIVSDPPKKKKKRPEKSKSK